jgi:hypothetical protein
MRKKIRAAVPGSSSGCRWKPSKALTPGRDGKNEKARPAPARTARVYLPLLQEEISVLLQLPLRFSDLRKVLQGESVGHQQRPDLGLSRLRPHPHDLLNCNKSIVDPCRQAGMFPTGIGNAMAGDMIILCAVAFKEQDHG